MKNIGLYGLGIFAAMSTVCLTHCRVAHPVSEIPRIELSPSGKRWPEHELIAAFYEWWNHRTEGRTVDDIIRKLGPPSSCDTRGEKWQYYWRSPGKRFLAVSVKPESGVISSACCPFSY